MGKKSAPPTPDYAAAAQQQGQANLEAGRQQSLLNNPNMVTPYGTSTYGAPDASGRATLTQQLSPAELAKLQGSDAAQLAALGILNSDIPNIASALSGAFGLGGQGPIQGFAPGTQLGSTQIDPGLAAAGNVQRGLDFSGAPPMPVANEAARQAVTNAVYNQGARFLDPQFAQQTRDLTSGLANQGITQGSDAAGWAQDRLARQKALAYGNLQDQATQTGISALQSLFGMGLGARQQGVGEIAGQGQFANAAQAQGVQNLLSSMMAHNTGVAQQANIGSLLTQLMNQGRAQQFSEYGANRTMPINMLTALLSASQVNNPQFQPTTPTSIIPTPFLQGAQLQGQANAANRSANAGKFGSALNAGGQIGASLPWAGMFGV